MIFAAFTRDVTRSALILPENMRHVISAALSAYGFGLSQANSLSENDMPLSYFIVFPLFSFIANS
jgi:hypothetical protein